MQESHKGFLTGMGKYLPGKNRFSGVIFAPG